MPYRHAHHYLLLLFLLIGLAFYPAYWSQFSTVPYAFHVHAMTASFWIILLAFQSWSIHCRRNALHRSVGMASFALFPPFVVGGLLVVQTMAVKFATKSDIFYVVFGARLGAIDLLSSAAIPFFFFQALKYRHQVHLHARWMLAPILFLLPPILSRLMPALPPLSISGPEQFYRFSYGLHIADGLVVALAAFLYMRAPKHGRPWLVIAILVAAQSLLFESIGKSAAWKSAFIAIGAMPPLLIVAIGLVAAIGATWTGWVAVPRRARAGPAAAA